MAPGPDMALTVKEAGMPRLRQGDQLHVSRPVLLAASIALCVFTALLLGVGATAKPAPQAAAAFTVEHVLLIMLAVSCTASLLLWVRCRELRDHVRTRLEAERRSLDLAAQDPLTGLGNRRALSERLDGITNRASGGDASEARFALLLLDLDRFKAVNDLHGHGAGDRLLCAVAHRLRACVRGLERNVFRIGGDEFAVMVEAEDALGDAPERVAQRIVDAMADPFADGPLKHHIGCSVGIARFPLHGDDGQTLLRRADVALYQAKAEGRCCARMFDPEMDAALRRRAALEVAVREGLARGEFYPNYQPIVNLETGAITGFHMLARWQGAERLAAGLPGEGGEGFGPAAFIRIAEECGLIAPLLLSLVERACGEARGWGDGFSLTVTLSPVQFRDPLYAQELLSILERTRFPAQRLAVKVSEQAIVSCRPAASALLAELRAAGVTVELDGFGTGQLSLMDLALLPLDRIKLDRQFIHALETDPETIAVARAIDSLARGLGLVLTADGVESPQIAELLRDLGCSVGQGWHFGRPMDSADVSALIGAGRASSPTGMRPLPLELFGRSGIHG